jgi:hypothetical protein
MTGRRRARTGAARGAAAILLAAAVVAGCGSGSTSAETKWADSLCGALDTWSKSVRSAAGDAVKTPITKASVQAAATEISDANAKLGDDLQSAGKPPGGTATKAKQATTKLTDASKRELATIESAVAGISSLQDVPQAVTTVTAALSTMQEELKSAAAKLKELGADDAKWKKAFSEAKSCQELSRS